MLLMILMMMMMMKESEGLTLTFNLLLLPTKSTTIHQYFIDMIIHGKSQKSNQDTGRNRESEVKEAPDILVFFVKLRNDRTLLNIACCDMNKDIPKKAACEYVRSLIVTVDQSF